MLACHFHKLAVTRPGLSSGKFRVRSHERPFPFPLGGGSPLPSRSSLRITLGPSAYGYYRTGNFWSPHREREKALNGRNLPHPPWASRSDSHARLCSCFLRTYTGRADHLSEGWSSRRARCPFFGVSRSCGGELSCRCPWAGLFAPFFPSVSCLFCCSSLNLLVRLTLPPRSIFSFFRRLLARWSNQPRRSRRRRGRAGELDQCGRLEAAWRHLQAKPQPITI